MKSKKKQTINIKNIWKIYKLPIIIILVVLLLIFIISQGLKSTNTKHDPSKYIFDQSKLITIYDQGLYGFITASGKVVAKPKYDYVIDTYGKYAIAEKNGAYYMLDNTGKEKLESKSSITYDSANDLYVADSKLYNSKLNAISPKKLNVVNAGHGFYRFIAEDKKSAGVLNSKGKVVYTRKIDEGSLFYIYVGDVDENQEDIYCSVSVDNQYYSIINCNTGKEIVKMSGSIISTMGNNLFYIQESSDKPIRTVYIKNDKIVFDKTKIDNINYYVAGYIEYEENDQYLYYDIKKNKTLKERPESLYNTISLSEWEDKTGNKKISCTKEYGIISNKKVVLPCEYDKITFLPYQLYKYISSKGKNYTLVQQNDKTKVVNLDNRKVVHTFDTLATINMLSSSPIIYYYDDDNKLVLYNLLTNKEKTFDAETVDVYGNHFKLHKGKTTTYYNLKFQKIYETKEA